MRHLMRDDDGAVALIVAVFLLFFIGMTALVVDAGYMYSVRRQLQAAADAAALAGCQEIILGATPDNALAVARTYAEGDGSKPYNAVKPADGVTMIMTPPDTEVTDEYVKVSVQKDTGLFFGNTFGIGSRTIHAQAIAKVAYLTGLRGIMPWAVPIVRPTHVTARVGGGSEVELSQDESGAWTGMVPVYTGSAGSRIVQVTAYNSQTEYPDGTSNGYPTGVPETVEVAGAVTVEATGVPILGLHLSKSYVTAGVDSSVELYVEATATPTAKFDGKTYGMSLVSGNTYVVSLPVPAVDQLHQSFAISVTVGKGAAAVTLDPAAVLVVRRSTYPISNVSISPTLFRQDTGVHYVDVSVGLVQYVYGNKYSLKVIGGGAEVGNFCALDLATIRETPYWRNPQDPAKFDVSTDPNYSPPAYYNYIENRFPFSVGLGDTIWTQTGAMSGPQTEGALDTRFGSDSLSFAEWSVTKPKSSRVVYVPVVEKMQDVTGQNPVRVIAFAAFYIDPSTDAKKDVIEGYFIEFVAPADSISEDPPAGFAIKTPHLIPASY